MDPVVVGNRVALLLALSPAPPFAPVTRAVAGGRSRAAPPARSQLPRVPPTAARAAAPLFVRRPPTRARLRSRCTPAPSAAACARGRAAAARLCRPPLRRRVGLRGCCTRPDEREDVLHYGAGPHAQRPLPPPDLARDSPSCAASAASPRARSPPLQPRELARARRRPSCADPAARSRRSSRVAWRQPSRGGDVLRGAVRGLQAVHARDGGRRRHRRGAAGCGLGLHGGAALLVPRPQQPRSAQGRPLRLHRHGRLDPVEGQAGASATTATLTKTPPLLALLHPGQRKSAESFRLPPGHANERERSRELEDCRTLRRPPHLREGAAPLDNTGRGELLDEYTDKISGMDVRYATLGATLDDVAMVKKLLNVVLDQAVFVMWKRYRLRSTWQAKAFDEHSWGRTQASETGDSQLLLTAAE